MKKEYRVQWTEIVTYETYIEADSPEKARDLFMDGEFSENEELSREFNTDDFVYVDGEIV